MAQNFEQYEIPEMKKEQELIGGFLVDQGGLGTQNLEIDSGGPNIAKIVAGQGANSGGINAAGASGDIVIWAGSAHSDRATAPFRVDAAGNLVATSVTVLNVLLGIQATDFNVSNGATDEEVFAKTVAANTLGANGGFRVTITGEAPISTSEATTSVKVNFGGTTIYASPDLTENPQKKFKIEVSVFNRNGTGSQIAYGKTEISDKDNPSTVAGVFYAQTGITASIDTTADKTIQVTCSESGTSGGANPVINYVVIERLR